MVPGIHQVITGGLAGRRGAARFLGGGFREAPRGATRAEHLIGGDVVETKAIGAFDWQRLPVGAHRPFSRWKVPVTLLSKKAQSGELVEP